MSQLKLAMGDQTPKVNSNVTFGRKEYEKIIDAKKKEANVSMSELIMRAINAYFPDPLPEPKGLEISPNLQILSAPPKPVNVEEKIGMEEIDKLFTEGWTNERRLKLLKHGSNSKDSTNSTASRMDSQPTKYYR